MFSLGGKWNEFLDAQRCDQEGNPLPGAETLHLWKVRMLCAWLPDWIFERMSSSALWCGLTGCGGCRRGWSKTHPTWLLLYFCFVGSRA